MVIYETLCRFKTIPIHQNEVNESIKYNLINTQFIGKDVSFKKNLSDLLGLHAFLLQMVLMQFTYL